MRTLTASRPGSSGVFFGKSQCVWCTGAVKPQIYRLTNVKEMPEGWRRLLGGGAAYMIFNPDARVHVLLEPKHHSSLPCKAHMRRFSVSLIQRRIKIFTLNSHLPVLTDWNWQKYLKFSDLINYNLMTKPLDQNYAWMQSRKKSNLMLLFIIVKISVVFLSLVVPAAV